MAGLRVQARRNARLQFRPQLRELNQLKREAGAMYRTGTRAERQAARGIIAAADRAIAGVRQDYREAGEESRLANRIGGKRGAGIFADADALSRRQTARHLSESIASEIGDLRARMVRAREGAAYSERQLRGDYQGTLGDIQKKRGQVRADMGEFALSELERLKDEQESRRLEQQRIALSERSVAATEGGLQLRRDTLAAQRRNRTGPYAQPGDDDGGRGPEKARSQAIKQQIIDARAKIERELNKNVPLRRILKDAAENNVQPTILQPALRLAQGQRLTPAQVQNLRRIGARVPAAWRPAPSRGPIDNIRRW